MGLLPGPPARPLRRPDRSLTSALPTRTPFRPPEGDEDDDIDQGRHRRDRDRRGSRRGAHRRREDRGGAAPRQRHRRRRRAGRRGHRRHRQACRARRGGRPHPHGASLRRDVRLRHLRDGHQGRGLGRNHHHLGLRGAEVRRERSGVSRRLDGQGRGQLRRRLRLPHDHRRRRQRLAQGDGPAGQRGHHQLQAVHGLSGGVPRRRRPDPEGHAAGRGQRWARHDARRERPGHRRAGRAGLRTGRDQPGHPRIRAPQGAGVRGHPPGHPAGQGGRGAAVHRPPLGQGGARAGGDGPRHRHERVRRDVPAVPALQPGGAPRPARLRGRRLRVLHSDPIPGRGSSRRDVEGPAHQRLGRGVHRPLPRSA